MREAVTVGCQSFAVAPAFIRSFMLLKKEVFNQLRANAWSSHAVWHHGLGFPRLCAQTAYGITVELSVEDCLTAAQPASRVQNTLDEVNVRAALSIKLGDEYVVNDT